MTLFNKYRIVMFVFLIILLGMLTIVFVTVSKDTEVKMTVILKNSVLTEYWKEVKRGIDNAETDLSVEVMYKFAKSENDIKGQIILIEEAILEKPDIILLASNDYKALSEVCRKVKDQGIVLVTIDSGVAYDGVDSFVATDNYEAGFSLGNTLGKGLNEEDAIMIMNYVKGSQTAIEREKGVVDSLKAQGIDKYHIFYCDDDRKKAYDIASNLFEEGSFKGVASLNETASLGVADALDEKDLGEVVTMIAYDSSSEEVKYLERGIIDALIVQKPFNIGYLGVKTGVDIYRRVPTNKNINTGSKLIYKETMYEKENINLIFPFVE